MAISSVIFEDSDDFYEDFGKRYRTHKKGLFILAPSGSGKTHFCKAQTEPHWIDGDEIWVEAKAQPDPTEKWWTKGLDTIDRIDQRSDVITMEAKRQGLWIMGASNFWLQPDGIVIPDWETHLGYIKHRQENDYDGGATTDALGQVHSHIAFIKKWHTDYGVPLFTSISEAVEALSAEAY
jgi:hypothetical protein